MWERYPIVCFLLFVVLFAANQEALTQTVSETIVAVPFSVESTQTIWGIYTSRSNEGSHKLELKAEVNFQGKEADFNFGYEFQKKVWDKHFDAANNPLDCYSKLGETIMLDRACRGKGKTDQRFGTLIQPVTPSVIALYYKQIGGHAAQWQVKIINKSSIKPKPIDEEVEGPDALSLLQDEGSPVVREIKARLVRYGVIPFADSDVNLEPVIRHTTKSDIFYWQRGRSRLGATVGVEEYATSDRRSTIATVGGLYRRDIGENTKVEVAVGSSSVFGSGAFEGGRPDGVIAEVSIEFENKVQQAFAGAGFRLPKMNPYAVRARYQLSKAPYHIGGDYVFSHRNHRLDGVFGIWSDEGDSELFEESSLPFSDSYIFGPPTRKRGFYLLGGVDFRTGRPSWGFGFSWGGSGGKVGHDASKIRKRTESE